jgi:hypothetical protein
VDFDCVSGCACNLKCPLEDRNYRMWYIQSMIKKQSQSGGGGGEWEQGNS